MKDYFFVLGRLPALSLAELSGLLGNLQVGLSKLEQVGDVVFVSSEQPIKVGEMLWRSGGLIKAGEMYRTVKLDESEVKETVVALLVAQAGEKKISFGVSVYGEGVDDKALVQELKKGLSEHGVSSAYIYGEDARLTTAQIDAHQLVDEPNAEVVLIVDGQKVRVGVTKAIQDFKQWSFIDYSRPARDPKSGMLPPKLARIMFNLGVSAYYQAQNRSESPKVYDPFCGSGTVLTEGMRLGLRVDGSDTSLKAVQDAQLNCKWLRETSEYQSSRGKRDYVFGYDYVDYLPQVAQYDVTHLAEHLEAESVDLIVTEPYLGPAMVESELPTPGKMERIIKGLQKLYIGALKDMHAVLSSNGILVFAEPSFIVDGKAYNVGIIDKGARFGYTSEQKVVNYRREKSIVGRRIGILKKIMGN